MAFFQLGIRRAALQLAQSSFVCRQCLRQQKFFSPSSSPASQPKILDFLRPAPRRYATTGSQAAPAASVKAAASAAFASTRGSGSSKSSSFPEVNSKAVGYWLMGSAVSVLGIIVFGGLTRLTESG